MSGSYLTQTLKENVVRGIKVSLLDAKDTVSPRIVNDALRIPKRQ